MIKFTVHEVDFNIPGTVSGMPWYDGDPEQFDATSLRYFLFPSRVTLRVGEVDVMGPRMLVPLFDLLSCIALELPGIRKRRLASINFTESADQVLFRPSKAGDGVDVVYAEARSRPGAVYFHEARKARADHQELVDTLTGFLASGLRQLTDNVAGLQQNQHVKALAAQL